MNPMLTAIEEAALVGKDQAVISRARRDPNHPVNGPNALALGRAKAAPEAEIRAYWKARPASKGGRPRKERSDG